MPFAQHSGSTSLFENGAFADIGEMTPNLPIIVVTIEWPIEHVGIGATRPCLWSLGEADRRAMMKVSSSRQRDEMGTDRHLFPIDQCRAHIAVDVILKTRQTMSPAPAFGRQRGNVFLTPPR